MIDQAILLKAMALKMYALDEGVMHECWSEADYAYAIEQDVTADKAWKTHLDILDAQRECAGYYERDTEESPIEPSVEEDTRDDSERYGSPAHAAYGDAWLYRDCPEAW